jgi:hypothetical protein
LPVPNINYTLQLSDVLESIILDFLEHGNECSIDLVKLSIEDNFSFAIGNEMIEFEEITHIGEIDLLFLAQCKCR